MKNIAIGELSKRSGVKVTTIRYYEKSGLLEEPDRSVGGQRLYTEADVKRITFVRHSRHLGFSLDAIRELLELQSRPEIDCGTANQIAKEQLTRVRERIAQLKALETELERITVACRGGSVGDCKVIEALGDHSQCETERHEKVAGF